MYTAIWIIIKKIGSWLQYLSALDVYGRRKLISKNTGKCKSIDNMYEMIILEIWFWSQIFFAVFQITICRCALKPTTTDGRAIRWFCWWPYNENNPAIYLFEVRNESCQLVAPTKQLGGSDRRQFSSFLNQRVTVYLTKFFYCIVLTFCSFYYTILVCSVQLETRTMHKKATNASISKEHSQS